MWTRTSAGHGTATAAVAGSRNWGPPTPPAVARCATTRHCGATTTRTVGRCSRMGASPWSNSAPPSPPPRPHFSGVPVLATAASAAPAPNHTATSATVVTSLPTTITRYTTGATTDCARHPVRLRGRAHRATRTSRAGPAARTCGRVFLVTAPACRFGIDADDVGLAAREPQHLGPAATDEDRRTRLLHRLRVRVVVA